MLTFRRSLNLQLATSCVRYLTSTVSLDNIGAAVAGSFRTGPDAAAQSIVESLPQADRALLLTALAAKESGQLDHEYVEQLFKHADSVVPYGALDRSELRTALAADRARAAAANNTTNDTAVPSLHTLTVVAIAAGVPLVGFGFLDNLIMIAAGDQIETTFGVKFGMSTMAAAGLGNLVSDVAGLGFADQIEAQARKLKWCRAPPLTSRQRSMPRTRVARVGGSVVGISIGCLIGMVPLLWIDQNKHAK